MVKPDLFVMVMAGVNMLSSLYLLSLSRSTTKYMERWQNYHLYGGPHPNAHAKTKKNIGARIWVRLFPCVALGLLLWLGTPTTAQASCSGFLDCLLGMTERTEIRNTRMIEVERIKADAAANVARVEGEADAHIKQAEAEVERVRQLQFESEAQRDIAIAQAQTQADQYKAMIAGLTDEKIAGIQANADTQIVALQEQARIAVAGITETGQTERFRIVGGWSAVIVTSILAALVGLYWIKRSIGRVMMVLPQPHTHHAALGERGQLPWYSDSVEIVEVKNNVITRR